MDASGAIAEPDYYLVEAASDGRLLDAWDYAEAGYDVADYWSRGMGSGKC